MKRALVTGITGQDGSYLAELLLEKGYTVHGTTSDPTSAAATALQQHASDLNRLTLHKISPAQPNELRVLAAALLPDEIYNLGAQSHVGESFTTPIDTITANSTSVAALLEAVRELQPRKEVRLYQASSSEMFGAPETYPQKETTPFHPRSPYACSKVCAFHLTVNYREAYGLFACNGILYNHESPRRPERYVTRKITRAAARIAAGVQQKLALGNLNVGRDWGYAKEYVDAMWRMLQLDAPDDFIIATNEWHTLEQFLNMAFEAVNLNWRDHVEIDPAFWRPAEVTRLQGDYSKAERTLGWTPTTKLRDLVQLMLDRDIKEAKQCV